MTRAPDPTVEAVLTLLCETFPKAFARYEARRRPLKINIHHGLQVALNGAITDTELRRALRAYCSNKMYRARLITGATRIDLDGNPSGSVSAEHAIGTLAKPRLKPGPKPKLKLEPESISKPTHLPSPSSVAAVKRLSLQDLREAARRRTAERDLTRTPP
jgi:ProP effector